MIMDKKEAQQFFEIYISLLCFTGKVEETQSSDHNTFVAARNYLFDNLDIFDAFIKKNPRNLKRSELEIIDSWKTKFVRDNFVFLKQLKKYAILVNCKEETDKVFAVLGLNDSPKDLVGIDGVYLQDVTLLPFQGKIIWDGLFYIGPIFGKNYLYSYNEIYRDIKNQNKIITQL